MTMEGGPRRRWLTPILGAVVGGIVALLIGAIWIVLAPDNGFADLAASAVTAVFLVPLGILIGAVGAVLRDRRHR